MNVWISYLRLGNPNKASCVCFPNWVPIDLQWSTRINNICNSRYSNRWFSNVCSQYHLQKRKKNELRKGSYIHSIGNSLTGDSFNQSSKYETHSKKLFVLLYLIMFHPFKCNANVMGFPCSLDLILKAQDHGGWDPLVQASFVKGTPSDIIPVNVRELRWVIQWLWYP